MKKIVILFWWMISSIFFTPVFAGEADVVDVKVTHMSGQEYRISVTLEHADTGWDHYANAWQIFDENDNLIGERVLHHPHVNEQPFTRSLTLNIPKDIKVIIIKGQDSVHGLGGKSLRVELPN